MTREMALMERMHCTYRELQETPNWVVEDYLLVMEAEAEGQQMKSRWEK